VNFLLDNALLILVALVSGGLLVWPMVRGGASGGSIGTAEAVRLINREKGVLIDVCEPQEFAAGHAIGARNVPLGTLANAKEGTKDSTKGLPTNKALPIIVMCASGARSTRAAAALRKMGYENVQPLSGGNSAWRAANLPTEKSAA
jgi:rhodanese-related sulfurtransferase